jgi:hypothetical protein
LSETARNQQGELTVSAQRSFVPLSPEALIRRLAHAIDLRSPGRLRIGFDGDETVGTTELADRVAAAMVDLGRPTIRISTRWWWRAASVRLEQGRHDVESRLTGWVDTGSLRREVIDPLAPAGSGQYLTRLRDPDRDRAVREAYLQAPEDAVLLLDGALLKSHGLPLDLIVTVGVSAGRLSRALPAGRLWELDAFAQYNRRWPTADVLLSYDHPDTPAVRGLPFIR